MLSYSKGPIIPLSDKTIWQLLVETAQCFPKRDALVVRHQNIRLAYEELQATVEQAARGLTALDLRQGDRIGIWSTNCLEWILIQLACARVGAISVNVNPAYRSYELGYVLERSRMKALFLWEKDRRSDYAAVLQQARTGRSLALEHVIYFGSEEWQKLMESDAQAPRHDADPHKVANIQYTSGTTGSPKGVLLSHYNLVNNALTCASGLRLTDSDRICAPLPLYHCFACVIGGIAALATGAALILPCPTFDPLATLTAIEEERATAIYGVPTMFIAQLEHPDFHTFDLSSLRTGVMGGAPCPVEVMKRVIADMHCPEMIIMYGQTEASPTVTMTRIDDPLEDRVATVGRACPNTEVKIVSRVSGEIVPCGEQGEVCTRGYLVMKGYDEGPEATRQCVDEEGWLHTGDLGIMRTDEYLCISGRAKDLIIRGGENISPREVEEFLHTHPKVGDVQVIGVPDQRLGEAVAAWIRLKEAATREEIIDFCQGRIAHFKIPQYIRFVDAFPMTVTGKIQKFKMREIEIEERSKAATS